MVGIFLVLQAAFGGWRLAALAVVLVPSALVGGLVMMFLGGGLLALGGVAGLIAVLGIATRTSIVLMR